MMLGQNLKKELKRQIKEDELVSGVEQAVNWVRAHQTAVQVGAAAAVVLVGGAWGITTWRQGQTRQAEAAFAEALTVIETPLKTELPQGAQVPAGMTVFDTAAEKYKRAAAAFDGVERRFSGQPAGVRARYFSALAREESGDLGEAQKIYETIAAQKAEGLEPSLAQLALAQLQRRRGKLKEAAEAFRKLAADPEWKLPKDHAVMEMARTLDEARQAADARAAYKRVTDEFPESVYAPEARRRAEELETAG